MSDAKFDGADMTEVVMSKAYAVGASFKGEKDINNSFQNYFPTKIFSIWEVPEWFDYQTSLFEIYYYFSSLYL